MSYSSPQELWADCKSGKFQSHTSGFCKGYSQANLIVLPEEVVNDFEGLCTRNPVPCPLLTKTISKNEVVDKRIIKLKDFDITTDIPKYSIFENGKLKESKSNITEEWTDKHVGFLIGCSFSFENELEKNGLSPKHQEEGKNVLMYLTTKYLNPSGIFVGCPYVVSMRPFKLDDVEKVRDICRPFMKTHGEPIDWGYDAIERLGIKDINQPEFGDSIKIADDEIPVFWACGVTPQAAVQSIGNKISGKVMSHSPGHMLILEISDEDVKLL